MYNVEEKTIAELAQDMAKGAVTSKQLVFEYLRRIAKYDSCENGLNSVLEVNPDAIYIAEAMDEERKHGTVRSMLHGIPFLVKDNIATADKMHTSAGSLSLKDMYAPFDATIVTQLREAGAVLLGKANMSEYAYFMSTTMPNGYSSRGGQVVSPYVRGADTSGSSTGSAVAVAANLCAFAIGTETDCSIICPSRNAALVGLKPTVGLVSRYGIVPISGTQDTAGPMCRTVEDAALVLNALTGVDDMDAATAKSAYYYRTDYETYLDKGALAGMRIGVNRGYITNFKQNEPELFEAAVAKLRELGADVVDGCDMPLMDNDLPLMLGEFKSALNAYLAAMGEAAPVKTLADVIKFNIDDPERRLKYGQELFYRSEYEFSGRLTEPKYIELLLSNLEKSRGGIDALLQKAGGEVIMCPGSFDVAPISGYPVICVPIGFKKDGMPFAATFVATAFNEPAIIKAAYAFEQATKHRKPPVLD